MPKIVINEIDKTKAGTTEYANFSVVVPGFLGAAGEAYEAEVEAGRAVAAFDENGVYECSSQSDFESKVGLSNWSFNIDRFVRSPIAPTITLILKYNEELAKVASGDSGASSDLEKITNPANISATTIAGKVIHTWEYDKRDTYLLAMTAFENKDPDLLSNDHVQKYGISGTGYDVYAGTIKPGSGDGYLRTDLGDGNILTFSPAVGRDTGVTTKMPKVEEGAFGADGLDLVYYNLNEYADDVHYIIHNNPVGAAEGVSSDLAGDLAGLAAGSIDPESYCPAGLDGYSVRDSVIHYGNQIAYELLGMGYTILYKKMTKEYVESLVTSASGYICNGKECKAVSIKTMADFVDHIYDDAAANSKLYRNPSTSSQDLANVPYECSAVAQLDDIDFWECLKDKSVYDFRYIITGTMDNCELANTRIIAIAEHDRKAKETGRGDCVALIDVDRSTYTGAGKTTQAGAIPYIADAASKYSSKYAAVFAPSVTYSMPEMKEYGNNCTFPGYFHYLACAAKSAENYNEWYANAGFARGIGKYNIESTGCKLGEVAIQALEPRWKTATKNGVVEVKADGTKTQRAVTVSTAVNLIVKIKNSYYLWGNRTCHPLGTEGASDGNLVASHFLNIRQLCSTIKKQVYTACRSLTFDPNSQILWINFCSLIEPTLEKMKSDQGIKDYQILPGTTTEKGTLAAKLRIVPIEAVEDFVIDLFLEDSLSGTDVSVDE